MIRHEHEVWINTIMEKVTIHSRLIEMIATAYLKYGNDYDIKRKELSEEADTLKDNIENSIYLKLDEVGESNCP